MPSISERSTSDQMRTYDRARSVVFLKTHEAFGGLSNMAGGFSLHVQGARIYTSEALYQACRFPHLPEVQRLIIGQASPMTAKMKSKPYRKESRPDWDRVRVRIMRWCLRVKVAQNWEKFSDLLLRTGDRPIVEESRKDDFWGAKPVDKWTLVGMNVLGRLLMELREAVRSQGREALQMVQPPAIPEFLLFGRQIEAVGAADLARQSSTPIARPAEGGALQGQASLFKVPTAREVSPSSYTTFERGEREPLGHLKPHPTMRDSGVPWLGSVPIGWNVRRLRNVADMRVSNVDKHTQEDEEPVRLCNYVDVYKNARIDPSIPFMRATATKDEVARFRLAQGDVLITKDSETWNDIGVPALVVQSADDLVSGYHLALLRPFTDCILGAYLFRALQSTGVAYQFHVEANGVTRYGLSHSAIRSVWLPVPPLSEQASIVRFLDHVDRRIRRYIRAKQKLIKLLEEQKQAIIHRVVTRGLDPNVALKPSGVRWLGDIPEHWEVREVRRVISFVTSGSRGWAGYYSETGDIFIQSGNLGRSMALDFSFMQHVQPPRGAEGERTKVQPDDVLVCITGALTGNVAIVDVDLPVPAYVNQHVALVRTNAAAVYARFLAFALYSEVGKVQFKINEYGGTKQGLGLDDVKSALVPFPPVAEQRQICSDLDSRLRILVSASSATDREIALLRECRTRLIADVVTGKLDVREAAARLPDEADDREPRDEVDTEADVEESSDDLDAVVAEADP